MDLETILSICLGIGLGAACGFRVFLPPLIAGIAAAAGHVSLPESAQWLASTPALLVLGTAALLEIGAYFIPWVDHLLDTIAAPLAVVAGTLLTASLIVDTGPLLRWSLALIAGGGAAATTQALSSTTRAASSVTTGGLANPAVAGIESAASAGTSMLAIASPILAVILVGLMATMAGRLILRARRRQFRD